MEMEIGTSAELTTVGAVLKFLQVFKCTWD